MTGLDPGYMFPQAQGFLLMKHSFLVSCHLQQPEMPPELLSWRGHFAVFWEGEGGSGAWFEQKASIITEINLSINHLLWLVIFLMTILRKFQRKKISLQSPGLLARLYAKKLALFSNFLVFQVWFKILGLVKLLKAPLWAVNVTIPCPFRERNKGLDRVRHSCKWDHGPKGFKAKARGQEKVLYSHSISLQQETLGRQKLLDCE